MQLFCYHDFMLTQNSVEGVMGAY